MKVFKFKKHKDGYEDRKQGASLRYPLEVDAFFESQSLRRSTKRGASAVEAWTSSSAPSGSTVPPATGLPLGASTAETGASPSVPARGAAPPMMGLLSGVLTVETSTRDASEGVDHPTPPPTPLLKAK